MKVKNQLLQLKPYLPGKSVDAVKKEYGLEKITKLASNENPFGTSEKAKMAIFNCVDSLVSYPDGYSTNVREKVAKHLGVDESQIIFGNGSDEVIQIICRSYLSAGKNTVSAWPTFSQYRHNAIIEGAEVREVPLQNGKHDLEGMLASVDNDTSVVWVCNPNNPSGTYVDNQELVSFLEKIPSHVLVVIDEAYFEYVTAEDYPETVKLLEDYRNLIILRTFSKAYGLAALRIGYGVASSELIREIEPAREPFNNNKLAQFAAAAAMEDQQFILDCKRKNKEGLEQYYAFCSKHNLSYYKSEGNFILIDFNRQGDEVFQYLLERGYIVRSGNALGFPTAIRITIGTQEQNEGIISTLTEMLEENNVVC